MEDSHKIVSCLHGNSKEGFFGVYDGHGGKKAVEFVAENLHTNILEKIANCEGNASKEEAVKSGYFKTDEEFLKQVDQYIHRILVEEDANNSESNALLFHASSDVGEKLYRRGDFAESKMANLDNYLLREFQLPKQWAPVFGELALGPDWKQQTNASLQFSFMGPKLYVNTMPVDVGKKPVTTGLRLYLEGKRSNCLAIHL